MRWIGVVAGDHRLIDRERSEEARQRSLIATSCLRGLLLQKLLTPEADMDAAACRLIDSWA